MMRVRLKKIVVHNKSMSSLLSVYDPSYEPSENSNFSNTSSIATESSTPRKAISNFTEMDVETCVIAYLCKLKELVKHCPQCGEKLRPNDVKVKTIGNAASILISCPADHVVDWESQPKINKHFLGNIAVVSATVTSGNTFTTLSKISEAMNLHQVSQSSFFRTQSRLIEPVVHELLMVFKKKW